MTVIEIDVATALELLRSDAETVVLHAAGDGVEITLTLPARADEQTSPVDTPIVPIDVTPKPKAATTAPPPRYEQRRVARLRRLRPSVQVRSRTLASPQRDPRRETVAPGSAPARGSLRPTRTAGRRCRTYAEADASDRADGEASIRPGPHPRRSSERDLTA